MFGLVPPELAKGPLAVTLATVPPPPPPTTGYLVY